MSDDIHRLRPHHTVPADLWIYIAISRYHVSTHLPRLFRHPLRPVYFDSPESTKPLTTLALEFE